MRLDKPERHFVLELHRSKFRPRGSPLLVQMAGGNSNTQFCGWKKSLGVPTTTAPAVNSVIRKRIPEKHLGSYNLCDDRTPEQRFVAANHHAPSTKEQRVLVRVLHPHSVIAILSLPRR